MINRTSSIRLLALTGAALFVVALSPASAQDVGRVDELVNVAYGTPPGATKVRVENAHAVVMNEELETDAQSALRVVFLDGSELTMGESSSAVIDEFVYTGATGNSSLNLVKGAFRFVSGEMPKENVEIQTPAVTMGIRGTDLRIRIGEDGTTRLVVRSGEAFIKGKASGFKTTVPSGHEIMADKFGRFSKVAPAGQGDAPKNLGPLIGDVAIDETLKDADEKWEMADKDGSGFNTARSRTVAALTGNTSHIGSGQGLATGNWRDRYLGQDAATDPYKNQNNAQPTGVYVAEGPVEESPWVVTTGVASTHYASGTTFGPITAPDGGNIDSLNNAGMSETVMVKEYTMGADQRYLSLAGIANFVTTEYPNFVGTQYNDEITIIVTTPGGQSATFTLAELYGASVNTSTFSPVSGLPFPMVGPGNVPPDSGGQTGWSAFMQRLRVAPGGTVRLEVHVKNAVDTNYPSAGLLSGVRASGGR